MGGGKVESKTKQNGGRVGVESQSTKVGGWRVESECKTEREGGRWNQKEKRGGRVEGGIEK